MRIENSRFDVDCSRDETWLTRLARPLREFSHTYPLRLAVVEADDRVATVEATLIHFDPDDPFARGFDDVELIAPLAQRASRAPFCAVQVIPTGLRCEFGGYAGDAGPATNLLAAASDFLVTHPNAVNASELNEMAHNVLYVEGKSLDDFLLGRLGLERVRANRIGTFIDPTGRDYLGEVINALNAARAVGGIDCGLYDLMKREVGVRIEWSQAGCAVGTVDYPEVILEAAARLIGEGVDAIGGVSVIHGVTGRMFKEHLDGRIPNPSGGVEAIITHLISKIFRVPTAHSPLPYYQDVKEKDVRNPRASAEMISTPHYFCVLKGLARAPRLVPLTSLDSPRSDLLTLNHVGAVVMPASCLGGVPAFAAEYNQIPLIAVRENRTILQMTNDKMRLENVLEVESYLEAAGALLALREGISFESLRRPLPAARRLLTDAKFEVFAEATLSEEC